ncbi:MAG: Uma2 family endonuclease [Lachnospiraceae bacterium]|nr:Uma2 family endonuclease [Lachnospiraceae bacterium]
MGLPREKYCTVEDYYNMPDDIRAELIDGEIVYMASPSRIHQKILGELHFAILNYIKTKGGKCEVYPAPFGVQLDENEDTVLEPDISVICDPDKLNDRGCLGAPDWIIEIASPSNPKNDYITKLNLYSNAHVREYWIVDPENNGIHVYSMDGDKFAVNAYTFQDIVKVGIYEDLYIDFASLDLGR